MIHLYRNIMRQWYHLVSKQMYRRVDRSRNTLGTLCRLYHVVPKFSCMFDLLQQMLQRFGLPADQKYPYRSCDINTDQARPGYIGLHRDGANRESLASRRSLPLDFRLYEKHPCLYDVRLRGYTDRGKIEAAIYDVSTALEINSEYEI